VLDLTGLDRVLEHAAHDMVVRAEAGVRFADLQKQLAAAGQRVALESAYPDATVGGIVATGSAGPSRYLYGTPRDLLIGVTVVLSDGTVARSGGKVVKNVAGYDLGKLYTGSFGTLGAITAVTFRLHPLPAARQFVSAAFDRPAELAGAVSRLKRSQLVPTAIEVERTGSCWTLTVLVEGVAAGVERRAGNAARLIGGEPAAEPPGWATLPKPPGGSLVKLVAEPAAVAECLTWLDRETGGVDAAYSLRGSAAVNVLYAGVSAAAEPGALRAALAAVRERLAGRDASLVLLSAPDAVRAGFDSWGPVKGLELMRRVKREFDPAGTLAPGRFVGGI
jgi:glycolate oxidase FAD binding subunit